ncbi:glycogen debranching N-terminal domain-containing protein [Microbacterium sp. TNHR37B]|uniref:glycogen debranching N-terminal domain-containing protein n=1 Tax=Microbacterium sp. TNHR37B TaxID=1775956 RepID=UPI0007B1FC40|nr:glycogen debranching N-terminal domain-containing protein [Microbacterium sp. TNHR37B]KZE91520.1 hypothetical protein AVP41_01062 [Microbacterium sp. TNHR37B]
MTDGLQPFLSDRVVALSAPTQAWSGSDGDLGAATIDGFYHGDTRFVRTLRLEYAGADTPFAAPEWIRATSPAAGEVRFDAVLRGIDDPFPDPKVRLERVRRVTDGRVTETVTVRSHLAEPVSLRVRSTWEPDFTALQQVKAGAAERSSWGAESVSDGLRVSSGAAALQVRTDGAEVVIGADIALTWTREVAAFGTATVEWSVTMDDPSLVVRGVAAPAPWQTPEVAPAADPRLSRWLDRALGDLDALRLALPDHPDDVFFAAGAPWFFTLFGRDSLWAARLLLPLDVTTAASTLRVLARLQGTKNDPETAEQPGKIMHELRSGELAMPGEGIVLPPLYYGTVDATALWVCLLVEAAEAGMPEAEVRTLLPRLEAALEWITTSVGAHGFLDYVDETGHGLSNQGWKDSGDSIQWRSGALAEGPIALSEVQGYAYEAAQGAADLLDRFDRPGSSELREWAAQLKERFAERFWVTTAEGRYPAIALDRHGAPVDTLTTNAGHLLGTGILDPEDEAAVSALLCGPTVSSGFGLRTLSTQAAGYWPLSYHGGSVWTHDTAIVARGMARAGLTDDARSIVAGLLAAAEAFDYRVPELHAGDDAREVTAPSPYPAACRPQAWSAAAAVTAWEIAGR